MRFMMFVKASKDSESGALPDSKLIDDMQKYNEELVKAGALLAGEGLYPSDKGARVRYSGSKRTLVDGPFPETEQLVAGYWLIDVKSREEALEWAKRVPFEEGEVELRPIFETDDFGDALSPRQKEAEARLREEIQAQHP